MQTSNRTEGRQAEETTYSLPISGAELTELLRGSLGRLESFDQTLMAMTPLRPGVSGTSPERKFSKSVKIFSELAILLYQVRGTSAANICRRSLDVLSRILDSATEFTLADVPPSQALPTAQLLIYAPSTKPDLARSLLLDPAFMQLYRDPSVELCYRHLVKEVSGNSSFWWSDLINKVLCNNVLDHHRLRRVDSYAFTHEVFYLTSFGSKELPSDVNRLSVELIANELARRAHAMSDDDLLIELLIVMRSCDLEIEPEIFQSLVERSRNGWFIGPQFSSLLAESLHPQAARAYEFEAQYHCLVVWCMLLNKILYDAVTNASEFENSL